MAKAKEFIIKNIKWIILFMCLITFFAIAEDVLEYEIMSWDKKGYELISKYLISDIKTPIAKVITQLGGPIFIIVLSLVILLLIKDKKIGKLIWLNLILSTGLNFLLKNIIQRPRPTEFRIINENGYSFPSGHSMISAAFYGFLIYIIYKKVKNKYLKWSSIIILNILIVLIGISRIYLGVHYCSDVLAGFLISISYLIIYTSAIKNYYEIN